MVEQHYFSTASHIAPRIISMSNSIVDYNAGAASEYEPSTSCCGVGDELMTCYEFITLVDPEPDEPRDGPPGATTTTMRDAQKARERAEYLLTMKNRLHQEQAKLNPEKDVSELDLCVGFWTCQDPENSSLAGHHKEDPPSPVDAPSVVAPTILVGDGSVVSPIALVTDEFDDAEHKQHEHDDPPGANRERGNDAPPDDFDDGVQQWEALTRSRKWVYSRAGGGFSHRYEQQTNSFTRSNNDRRRPQPESLRHHYFRNRGASCPSDEEREDSEESTRMLSPEEAEPWVDIEDTTTSGDVGNDFRYRAQRKSNRYNSIYHQNDTMASRSRLARHEAAYHHPHNERSYHRGEYFTEEEPRRSSPRSDKHKKQSHTPSNNKRSSKPTVYNHNPVVAARGAREAIERRHDVSPSQRRHHRKKQPPARDSDTVQACAGGPATADCESSDLDTDRSSMSNKVMVVVVVRTVCSSIQSLWFLSCLPHVLFCVHSTQLTKTMTSIIPCPFCYSVGHNWTEQ